MKNYCKNFDCKCEDCPGHYTRIDPMNRDVTLVHLEGNPMYCIKRDWNDNQYKEECDA